MCGIVISSRVEDVLSVWSPHKTARVRCVFSAGSSYWRWHPTRRWNTSATATRPHYEKAQTQTASSMTSRRSRASEPHTPAAYVWENIDAYMGVRQLGRAAAGADKRKEGDDGWEQVGIPAGRG